MQELSELERQNYDRQAELIHLTLGLHEARLRDGHPFALHIKTNHLSTSRGARGPARLHRELNGKIRVALDLMKISLVESPTSLIQRGILASLWDTYNQIHGLMDSSIPTKFHDFLTDPELSALVDESNRVGDRIREEEDTDFRPRHYFGASTIHSGFEAGVNVLIRLSALECGLPEKHPFDAMNVAKIIANSGPGPLGLAQSDLCALHPMNPALIGQFVDAGTKTGITDKQLAGFAHPNEKSRCPVLMPMGDMSRELLKRHNLYVPEFDGPPAIKIIGEKIREYVKTCFWNLRVTLEDSRHLPTFDKLILDRRIAEA